MSDPLLFSELQSTSNYSFTRQFPLSVNLENMEVALLSASIPNSFSNFDSSNGTFSYIYQGNTFNVDLCANAPQGRVFMDLPAIQTALQNTFIANGHYCVDSLGLKVFYINFRIAAPIYRYEIAFSVVNVPTGGTNPNNLVLGNTMQLVVTNPNGVGFGRRIGFSAGTYPPAPSPLIQIYQSTMAPQITDLLAIGITLSCIPQNGSYGIPSLCALVPVDQPYLSTISVQPIHLLFYPVASQNYSSMTCTIVDQNGASLVNSNDPNCVFSFVLRKRQQ